MEEERKEQRAIYLHGFPPWHMVQYPELSLFFCTVKVQLIGTEVVKGLE